MCPEPRGSNKLFPPDQFVTGATDSTLAAQHSLGSLLLHGNSHNVCLWFRAVWTSDLGATGDGGFHLDNHAWATNLSSHKLAHIHGGAGSVAPHSSMSSPARSRSRTPPHGTSLVRFHSHSVSSTSSHTAAPESPAGSGSKGCEYSKSTSQDGNGTNDESAAGSDDEVPGDDEHQASESSDSASSSSDVKEAERSDGEAEGSTSQGSQSSLESDGEMPVHATMPPRETGKDTATKEAKTSAPSSSQLLLDADSKVTEAEWKCQ